MKFSFQNLKIELSHFDASPKLEISP